MAVKARLREEREKRKASAPADAAAATSASQNRAAEGPAQSNAGRDPAQGVAADGASAEAAEAAAAPGAGDGEPGAAEEAAGVGLAVGQTGTAAPLASPFACISATMGYSTFHMLQTLWLGVIDLPTNSSEKDWDLQARYRCLCQRRCLISAADPAIEHVVICRERTRSYPYCWQHGQIMRSF